MCLFCFAAQNSKEHLFLHYFLRWNKRSKHYQRPLFPFSEDFKRSDHETYNFVSGRKILFTLNEFGINCSKVFNLTLIIAIPYTWSITGKSVQQVIYEVPNTYLLYLGTVSVINEYAYKYL
jgi:hypothetical protein